MLHIVENNYENLQHYVINLRTSTLWSSEFFELIDVSLLAILSVIY